MHVAVHALARGNRTGELMGDRVAALVLRNGFVRGETESLVPVLAPPAGVRGRTIVRIDHMAGRATAGAIVARVIVRAEKSEERIMQPRFLQAEENRVGPVQRAETALGQAPERFAGRLFRRRQAQLQLLFTALLKDAQGISGIAQIETRERIEKRQDAVQHRVGWCDGCVVCDAELHAIGAVGLAEAIVLQIESAVIIKRRAPKHRAMGHHAVLDVANDLGVAEAAGLLGHTQIAWVDEADELVRFVIEPDVRVRRVGRGFPELLVARQDVRLLFR